jgi:hypothetical protein
MASAWQDDTDWRQGHFLPSAALNAFELDAAPRAGGIPVALVITHDCDLARPASVEPGVEVLVGRIRDGHPDGNFANGKSSRRLDIFLGHEISPKTLELDVIARRVLPKEEGSDEVPSLAQFQPDLTVSLSGDAKITLQHWLAARYRRAAYANEFNDRVRKLLESGMKKILANSGEDIEAVFFLVDNGKDQERSGKDDVYDLLVILLYSTRTDPSLAERTAVKAAREIRELLRKKCLTEIEGQERWQWIELQDVEIVPDTELVYSDFRRFRRWNFDHLSLRAEPVAPTFLG